MVRTLPCGCNAETVFKSPVCDLMGLDGRLHRKEHEAVTPQAIRKSGKGDHMLPFHIPLYQPIIVALEVNPIYLRIITTLSLSRRYDMPGADIVYRG